MEPDSQVSGPQVNGEPATKSRLAARVPANKPAGKTAGTAANKAASQAANTAANQEHLIKFPGRVLTRAFFEAPPDQVAPRLLGKLLVHRTPSAILVGRIVEVEAYLGPHHDPPDPAAHTHRGQTERNAVLFGPPGHAYVYSIYGRYFCVNVSCEREGRAGCVLLRALEPVAGMDEMARNRWLPSRGPGSNLTPASKNRSLGAPTVHESSALKPEAAARQLTSGPSRLCQALGLTRAVHNGLDLLDPASPLQVRDDGFTAREAMVTPRIGISHAQSIKRLLRFVLPESPCVSGPRTFVGRRISLG